MNISSHHQALFDQAKAAVKARNAEESVTRLRQLVREAREFAPAHLLLAQVLAPAPQHFKEALTHFQVATRLEPRNVNNWLSLASFFRVRKEWVQCRTVLNKALEIHPKNEQVLNALVVVYGRQKNYDALLKIADQGIATHAGKTHFVEAKGGALEGLGKPEEAFLQYDSVHEREDFSQRALERWVVLMVQQERGDEVIGWLKKAAQGAPDTVIYNILLSFALIDEARYNEAYDTLKKAEKKDKENTRILHDLGVVLRFLGRIDESKAYFQKTLSKDPYHVSALRVYGSEHKYKYGDQDFVRLNQAAARLDDYLSEAKVQLHYALGKAYEDVGEYPTAFDHYRVGGALHLSRNIEDESKKHTFVKEVKTRLTADYMQDLPEQGCESNKPVFVLGMPRSGTSLIEQVLSSHPAVYGAGELKYIPRALNGIDVAGQTISNRHNKGYFQEGTYASYQQRGQKIVEILEELAPPETLRIIDKMPANYVWAGFIHAILPNSYIIHSRRHPIDTCLSAYKIYFPQGQYWSFDLKKMGREYRLYIELMQHWRSILPSGRMLEVKYEEMVESLESQSRRLIDYLELPWDDNCLKFYQTDRAVKTASASQVRQPIYTSSMNRWHKYKPYLKPLLDEIGDLVEAYEGELEKS
jgi:tetratricopeptide (TPR) repeat protein